MSETVELIYSQDPVTGKLSDEPVGVRGVRIPISELAEYKRRHHLRTKQVIQRPNAETWIIFEPDDTAADKRSAESVAPAAPAQLSFLPAEIPDSEAPAPAAVEDPDPNMPGRLAALLDDLLFAAESEPGTPKRLPLRRGLRIDVLIDSTVTRLQLSRAGTWPSEKEWSTVLFHWPTKVPAGTQPNRRQARDRFYLSASWRR